ncbi:MAG: hypothetical protein RIB43_13880 [Rhodospirillaceae bacterium]
MTYINLTFQPGIYKDDSPLSAEGFFIDADKIRFVRGKPQTIGGWETASTDILTGVCRGIHPWLDNLGQVYAAFGTHERLHVFFDGEVYDITPVVSRGTLTDPFSTVDASPIVTVHHVAHGVTLDQTVRFSGASPVGGVTLDGAYVVAAVPDEDTYTVEHSIAAALSASGGGLVSYEYDLAPGLVDGTGGAGYGTGAYGVGGYGIASDIDYFLRSWSLSNWGQNLIANPRGGAIYEWAPNIGAVDLIEDGAFDSGSAWTVGADWSVGSGVASRVAGAGTSTLSQEVPLPQGAWCVLRFEVTAYSAGTLQPMIGAEAIGGAVAATGRYARLFFAGSGGAKTLQFSADAAGSFSIDNVAVTALPTASEILNAPAQATSILVTPERMLAALGCSDSDDNFDPLLVCWSDQENNQQWTATAANTAGFFKLAKGGRIVGGKPGRGENYIFTDEGLYSMRFVPDPTVVYRFDHVGSGCGLLGPNAAVVVGGQVFWWSNAGEFFKYAGGIPQPLQCTLRRDVFENLAQVQGDKVFAFRVAAYNEVWWLYPDRRDGNECSRYVAYNFVENVWTSGTFDRSAWIDSGVLRFPMATGLDGKIYFQEKGDSADGGVLSWHLQSGRTDAGSPDVHKDVYGLIPDFEDLKGGVTLTVQSWTYPGSPRADYGPYGITQNTGKIDVRAQGRDLAVLIEGSAAPAFMRLGTLRADIRQTHAKR